MRISDDIRKCVVFIGHGDDEHFTPSGTAFLISYEGYRYLVTAKHIASSLNDGPYHLRLNKSTGGSDTLHVDGDIQWFSHSDYNVDVAIAPFHYDFKAASYDVRIIPVTKDGQFPDAGIGDLTYTIGLFRFLAGKKTNVPIVHSGSIAMLPGDEKIPVRDWDVPDQIQKRKLIEGYLVECGGIQGLSGSPVFFRPPFEVEIPISPTQTSWAVASIRDVVLLGIWHAAWDAKPDEIAGANLGQNVTVPIGLGVVVPKNKLIDILESNAVAAHRSKAISEIKSALERNGT